MLLLLDICLIRPDLRSMAKTPSSVLRKMMPRPSAKPIVVGSLQGTRPGIVLSSKTLLCVHAAVLSGPVSLDHAGEPQTAAHCRHEDTAALVR